ncbi:MAG: hypothetical protein V7739_20745 [Motiliproteus sp.]
MVNHSYQQKKTQRIYLNLRIYKNYQAAMSEPNNPVNMFYSRLKKHPVVAALTLLGSIVIALSAFTNAAKNIVSLVSLETRPSINGQWTSKVSYPWMNRQFTETFYFSGDGADLIGSATFLRHNRAIIEGNVKDTSIQFITLREEIVGPESSRQVKNVYHGRLNGNTITFKLLINGSNVTPQPIEFTAHQLDSAHP